MTFVDSMDGRRRFPMNGIKQNSTAPFRNPLGPKNSLDYWQKAKDQQGVTYYWNPSANPYYGMDSIYAQQKSRPQRPSPFPLSIPPQPAQIKPRSPTIAPVLPIYHNLPTTTIQRVQDENRLLAASTTNGNLVQRTDIINGTKRPEPLIWSVQTDPLRELRSSPPKNFPPAIPAYGEKRPPARQKPRWGRFVQSLCCCVAPQAEIEKAAVPRNPSLLITQVQKNGGATNGTTLSDTTTDDFLTVTAGISPTILPEPVTAFSTTSYVFELSTSLGLLADLTVALCSLFDIYSSISIDPNITCPQSTGYSLAIAEMRTKRIFIEEFAIREDPSLLISNLVLRPGRTPTADEIIKRGLLGNSRRKTTGEKFLLPPVRPSDMNKKCLIIDLDETLVHSSFKPVKNPDFVIPVEIDGIVHQVYVLKRPYVDEFLARIGDRYECVLFTASLAKYADPVADLLDKRGVFRSRLFREACVYHKGNYVKDLARLGRDLSKVLIIDNSPASYAFHPENAIPVPTWWDDPSDVELLDILPLLERLEKAESIYEVLKHDDPVSEPLLERAQ
ncbi:hypothetical protein RB195_006511 [Necator americanus]|uniref:protein-serine/threonine phosphatase n=2 Tax=Necator americanus TaxID=51031 RepID=A0ABR1BVY8_NECAM